MRLLAAMTCIPDAQEQSTSIFTVPIGSQVLQTDADIEPEEIARVARVPATTLNMWATLLKSHGVSISEGKLSKGPSQPISSDQKESMPRHSPKQAERAIDEIGTSVLATFNRARSFGTGIMGHTVTSTSRQPFRRIVSAPSQHPACTESPASDLPVASSSQASLTGLFSGRIFQLLGEAKCQTVKSEIERCGGYVISGEDDADSADFILVRLISGSKLYLAETAAEPQTASKYRTECWLEKCIFEERICSVEEHWSFLPLKMEVGSVVGAERMYLSFSGLDQSEACWTRRLIRAIGKRFGTHYEYQ